MRRIAVLAVVFAAAVLAELGGAFVPSLDHPSIEYATRLLKNPVSELNRQLAESKAQLKFDGAQGYLRSVLEVLHVPIESQMLVFSKTSLQAPLISPRNARSIFFNDTTAVAWVHGEPFVELAVQDREQGVIFYTLDQKPADQPRFTRRDACLTCHDSYSSLGVPGMLVRSVVTAPDGKPMRQVGDYITDHRSPMDQRWGGWYVTGASGSVRHMGNATFDEKFETGAYLSPYSDIVALMVFDHQMHMTNLLTRVGWEIRVALYHDQMPKVQLESLLRDAANELVDCLLFVDEAPLGKKIQGTSGFAETFAAQGLRDRDGRSLRQLDLEKRMMRYPCSYMIYSEAFDGLPAPAREAIYKRMWQILSGEEHGEKYARLTLADRRAIVEILRETRRGLPDYFQPVTR